MCPFLYMYTHMRGKPKKLESFYKKLYIYCYMFKLQSPSKVTLHLMQYTYQGIFSHCSKQFLSLSILMPFSAFCSFCFTSSTSATCFPLRDIFIQENNKLLRVRSGEWGGWDSGAMTFLVKNC